MEIVFLYTQVMGYTEAVLSKIISLDRNIRINCVYWDNNNVYLFKNKFINYIPKSNFENKYSLNEFVENIGPKIIYISGWMDKDYLNVVKNQKSKGVTIVMGLDNQWRGTFKQYFASLFRFFLIKPYYDFAWIPGIKQYEFAKKLGFKHNQIIKYLYTADVNLFQKEFQSLILQDKKKIVLFVGRLEKEKGIEFLVDNFIEIGKFFPSWQLKIIGNGDLKGILKEKSIGYNIEMIDFLQPEELIKEAKVASIFCLPSVFEPWGLVIHEFSCLGLPLLISENCGSADEFLIDGFNGFKFRTNDTIDFKEKLTYLMNQNTLELFKMGQNGNLLSNNITPLKSATSFLSIMNKLKINS